MKECVIKFDGLQFEAGTEEDGNFIPFTVKLYQDQLGQQMYQIARHARTRLDLQEDAEVTIRFKGL